MGKIKGKEMLSMKWLNFCIYWRIPLSVIYGILNLLQFYGEVNNWNYLIIIFLIINVSMIILYIITFIFARNYTKVGYRLLYSLFIFETITYALATANNGTFNNNNEYILTLFIYFVVLGFFWFLPNHIYLKKRKQFFYGNDVKSENKSNKIYSSEEKATVPYIIQSKKSKNKFSNLLITLFILSFLFNIYQFISIQRNSNKINDLKSDLAFLEDDNVQLTLEKLDYVGKANFLDEYIVIVPSDGNRYYYTYDCFQKKFSGQAFYAYNINTATVQGYKQSGC